MISIADILYYIIIEPLTLIFEFIFSISYKLIPSPIIALTIMSIVVNFLVLPLYKRADVLQAEANASENAVKDMAKHIRKCFRGDERVMMLQTYYGHMKNSPYHYSPLNGIKSSVSLLLQIPFFIAAYSMISGLIVLRGSSAGFINDLSLPDRTFQIGSFSVNILPILMTLINIVSSEVFSKGKGLRDKIQLYVTALVFLVLLYNSPSGLVYYWTCNNIFSLFKNIVSNYFPARKSGVLRKADKTDGIIFVLCSLSLGLFVGLAVPSDYLTWATDDMIRIDNYINPVRYLPYSSSLAIGFVFIWVGVYFLLSTHKSIFNIVLLSVTLSSFVNYYALYKNYGTMHNDLTLNVFHITHDPKELVTDLVVFVLLLVLTIMIYRSKKKLFVPLCSALIVPVIVVSVVSINTVNGIYDSYDYIVGQTQTPQIHLSSTGRNVMVIMLDKAQGNFLPYILEEQDDLYGKFDGFTYYPNCISYGINTNTGSPAMLGGYDYTPAALNARDDITLREKHNEALLMLPVLFSQNGYESTVCDPPYADYHEISDLSIFDEYQVESYIANGAFNPYAEQINTSRDEIMKRDLFLYGCLMVCPKILRDGIYDEGYYNDLNQRYSTVFTQRFENCSVARGMNSDYLDSISVLDNLSQITDVTSQQTGCYLFIDNNTTHSPALLEEPGYTVSPTVDNTGYDSAHASRFNLDGEHLNWEDAENMMHYHVNAAAYIELGEWFDYLRECGVYDNTRIIIVSDHGASLDQGPGTCEDAFHASSYNPILMVKDFDAHGFTTSYDFMTNAEVAYLATEGLIEDPVNPFTGNPVRRMSDTEADRLCFFSAEHNVRTNNNNVFLPGDWYSLNDRDDILNTDSWTYEGTW